VRRPSGTGTSRNNSETPLHTGDIGPKQRPRIVRPSRKIAVRRRSGRKLRNKTMTRNTSKFASGVLTALLYAQGFLGFAGVTLVVLKERMHQEPTFVFGVASVDAER
jgi:hypothetical protein